VVKKGILATMKGGLQASFFCGIFSCCWAGILDGRGRIGLRLVLVLVEGLSRLEEEVELYEEGWLSEIGWSQAWGASLAIVTGLVEAVVVTHQVALGWTCS
jgi:hypothetical protein